MDNSATALTNCQVRVHAVGLSRNFRLLQLAGIAMPVHCWVRSRAGVALVRGRTWKRRRSNGPDTHRKRRRPPLQRGTSTTRWHD